MNRKLLKCSNIYEDDAEEEDSYIKSECAPLSFVGQLATIPAPRVYGWSFDQNNPVKWPYLLMDKIPGVTLYRAIRERWLDRNPVHKTLGDLAQIMKDLNGESPFREIGSHTVFDNEILEYIVDKKLSIYTYFDHFYEIYKYHDGPYPNSMMYDATLLNISWIDWVSGHRASATSEEVNRKIKSPYISRIDSFSLSPAHGS